MPYKDLKAKRQYDRDYWLRVKAKGTEAKSLPTDVVHALPYKVPRDGLKIAVVPDVQAMEGVEMDHLTAYGKYIAAKRPDVIVCLGDFGDFPSLSQFERGTRHFEGRRYKKDLAAFHRAMELFMEPIAVSKGYHPGLEFAYGNHEDHINRATVEDAKLEGLLSLADLRLADYGWRTHEFRRPFSIGGVAFCHYYPSGVMGRPITSARALLTKLHMSCVAGHQQGKDTAYARRADGGHLGAIISGSFYQHEYGYLSPFTNAHWRGAFFLHEVRDGGFDDMFLSIQYLRRRFL